MAKKNEIWYLFYTNPDSQQILHQAVGELYSSANQVLAKLQQVVGEIEDTKLHQVGAEMSEEKFYQVGREFPLPLGATTRTHASAAKGIARNQTADEKRNGTLICAKFAQV